MKLNLLPTTVSKGSQTRNAIILSVLLAVIAFGGALFLFMDSNQKLTQQKDSYEAWKTPAEDAVKYSHQADVVIAQAAPILRNIQLADAMNKHNDAYPDLYDAIKPYIPSFFRVTNMSAVSNGPDSCTVTLTGPIESYQQYADLMLALLRIPGPPITVTRAGYQLDDPMVPQITPEDQSARPHKPSEPTIPDDPLQRLENRINSGGVTGYLGQGGFGSGDDEARQAMPGESIITVNIVLPRNIQTPDPRATLSAQISTVPTTATQPANGANAFGAPPAPATAPKP